MKNQEDFSNFLTNVSHVPDKKLSHYVRWVDVFQGYFLGIVSQRAIAIQEFEEKLRRKYHEWQVRQAVASVKLYWYFLDREGEKKHTFEAKSGKRVECTEKMALLDEVRRMLRLMHRSYKTELSYLGWNRRFLEFMVISDICSNSFKREDITAADLKKFLTYLAVEERIASTTQQQAFNALLFLFRHVLQKPVDGLNDTVRAFKRKRLPGCEDSTGTLRSNGKTDLRRRIAIIRRHQHTRAGFRF
jgi:hypothetical protein